MMRALELKIPPPIIGLLCAGAMWALAHYAPAGLWANPWRAPLAAGLALVGLGCDVAGLLAFRRHRTTINPLAPERSSTVVQDGIYRITRNPMYLGMALLLIAWAVWLSHPWALLGPAAFVGYITRFQILPEERVLRERVGVAYEAYTHRVRRWL